MYLEMVMQVGQNMKEIQKNIPNKTVSQCRNFWMNNHKQYKLKELAPEGTLCGLNATYDSIKESGSDS